MKTRAKKCLEFMRRLLQKIRHEEKVHNTKNPLMT